MPSMANVDPRMPIAVVGLSCRFPGGANNEASLWDMLAQGRHAWSEIPKERLNAAAFYHPDNNRKGTFNVRGAHFLQHDIATFDAPFFSISNNEAKAMDPQQRMLLETTYEAFENAGIRVEDVVGSKTSCFVGSLSNDYGVNLHKDMEYSTRYHATGSINSILANRLSWFFDLKGPSVMLDTACSSSLVAFHLACQSLRTGEATSAIVGGCNLILNPDFFILLSGPGFLGPDGKCHTFDSSANGYGRGEGVASIILKPLDTALRDNDPIRAIVRGTATNHDGKTPGISLPSQKAQEDLIRSAYHSAGLDMSDTGYFEAHGTGTQAGDPIETGAIGNTIGIAKSPEDPLLIGSIKTNIGHLEGASGIAGIIKAVLILEKGLIPASLGFENPNPKIRFKDYNLKVVTELTPWPSSGVRRISVNSFGFGGANAHAILDVWCHEPAENNRLLSTINGNLNGTAEANSCSIKEINGYCPATQSSHSPQLITLSSNYEEGCHNYAQLLSSHLKMKLSDSSNYALHDISYTLGERRSKLLWRTSVVATSTTELCQNLATSPSRQVKSLPNRSLALVFSGQGAQWALMGRELMVFDCFRASLESAGAYLKLLGCAWDIIEELDRDATLSNVDQSTYSQPICTAIQVALVDLLFHLNIRPVAVVGHSSGEIAAAYCAGIISRESAWEVSYHRGRLCQKINQIDAHKAGAMLAVNLSEQQAEEILHQNLKLNVVVACVNSPSNVTLSGDREGIKSLERVLEERDVFTRQLRVEHAYHSPHMELISEEYLESIKHIKNKKEAQSAIRMFSSVSGYGITADELNPTYWVKNMVSPVRFSLAVQSMVRSFGNKKILRRNGRSAIDILLEVGPHSTLKGPLKQILDQEKLDVPYYHMLSRGKNSLITVLKAAGDLFTQGIAVNILRANRLDQFRLQSLKVLTDLPAYAWNHNHRFWYESRLSHDYRYRSGPRHHLLGAPTADHNILEPRWRNFLSISDSPWIREHVVQSRILYPGAGFIAMAIEAASQLVDRSKIVKGFELRDIQITRALQIPEEDDGVETMLHIRPWRAGSQATTSNWDEFVVYSHDPKLGWQDNARGLIVTHYYPKNAVLDRGREDEAQIETHRNENRQASNICSASVDIDMFYNRLESSGMQFGPSFRNMVDIRYSHRRSVCKLQILDTKVQMPNECEFNHVIHPITLDNIFHMALPAQVGSAKLNKDAYVPISIKSLYISTDIKNQPRTLLEDNSGFHATVIVSDSEWSNAQLKIEGLELKRLASMLLEGDTDNGGTLSRIVFHSIWKEDIDFISQDNAQGLFAERLKLNKSEHTTIEELEQAALVYMKRCLKRFKEPEIQKFSSHYQHFISWMQSQVDISNKFRIADSILENELIERARSRSVDGRIMCQVGDNLEALLIGSVDPLEVLLQDDLLHQYYANGLGLHRVYHQLSAYIDRLTHKYPNLAFLEIGAGTGGATQPILEVLGGHGDRPARFGSYTFTDISSGFFEKAQEKFNAWGEHLLYQKLNIEHDPSTQDFQSQSYDVIIAANVLHATSNMNVTMANALKLLKPGGKLIMIEITQQLMRIPMIMGILPGWWLGEEDGRHGGPTLQVHEWDQLLKRQGYSGVELYLPDYTEHSSDELFSVVISTALSNSPPESQTVPILNVLILAPIERSMDLHIIIAGLQKELLRSGYPSSVVSIDSMPSDISNYMCISLLEFDNPIIARIEDEEFVAIKRIMANTMGLLWVTRSGAFTRPDPEASMILGLARSIRAEQPNILLSTLDLSSAATDLAINKIHEVFHSITTHKHTLDFTSQDYEFSERNGYIWISRLQEYEPLNDLVTYPYKEKSPMVLFKQSKSPLKLEIREPGLLDSLQFTEDFKIREPPLNEEVEIEVKATGVNFIDIMVAMGKVPGVLGNECAGIVTRVGQSVTKFKPGDRVWTGVLGAYKSYVRCHESLFQLIPNGMSYETAASLVVIYMTAYYSLFEIARMRSGESILIHAAAGGVGQAAIVLAKTLDADIFVTVSSDEKKKLLMDRYAIPEDHIFNSRDLMFAKAIMRMTGNKGVDVVLNSLAGEALRLSFHCLAMYGRFIEMGKADILGNTGLDMSPFLRNVTFASVNVALIIDKDRETTSRIFAQMATLLHQGVFKEIYPITVYDYSEIEKVFRIMQTGSHIGKLVLKPTETSLVSVDPASQFPLMFNPHVSYLLVGGLGGLGRCIARWMVENGAKHLIFISRSGAQKLEAKQTLEILKESGSQTAVHACDISDANALKMVLDSCSQIMPPIRGVIQSAMVLQDGLFEKMTTDQFYAAVRPKVHGTQNLHNLLPQDLDFFTMLSSSAGIIGSRGQGNYAVGNTYQDAFAAYRRGQGLAASTVDLGLILDVGYVAENAEALQNIKRWGFVGISEQKFLQILRGAIACSRPSPSENVPSQFITGIGTGGVIQSIRNGDFPYYFNDARFSHLRHLDIKQSTTIGANRHSSREARSLGRQLENARSLGEAHNMIGLAFIEKISKLLLVPSGDISLTKPLNEYGVDSLVAVEIRNWIFHETRVNISVFQILSNDLISELCGKITAECPILRKLGDVGEEVLRT
ncbi:putative polyketide synthase [Xylogone sp. PMI_703]|nr:putative polyketide synthase [Xylogone sp. PMI_703]